MDVAVALYEEFTALDAVGPYEVLSRVPGATVTFVAARRGPVRSDSGGLAMTADLSLEELPNPEVVVMPGGPGQTRLMDDEAMLSWLRAAHETSRWTTSVCTGSLILGAAGILQGRRATSHWLALDQLRSLGAEPVSERVVFDGKVATAAGVSAGLDMSLALAAKLADVDVAQAIQLAIEYEPEPPFASGSPDAAPASVVEYLRAHSRFAAEGGGRG